MAKHNIDPFVMSAQQELESKYFTASVSRLKKKVHQCETIMYSQPFQDAKMDYKAVWNKKMSTLLSDDCGIPVLQKVRRSKPKLDRAYSVESNEESPGLCIET
jgi:hypothetical protein